MCDESYAGLHVWSSATEPLSLRFYEKPLQAEEPVVCMDEKSVSLHEEVREPIPFKPGRETREYRRAGTANIFCGVEPKAGVHFTAVTPRRTAHRFAEFSPGGGGFLSPGQDHASGAGQSQHASPQRRWWTATARLTESACGSGSPCTTRPNTAAG